MTDAVGSRLRLDQLLRQFRRHVGLTQQQVADLAGISVAGLRDLEQARVLNPRSGTLRRLALALELSAADTEELLRVGQSGEANRNNLWVGVLGPLTVHVDGTDADPGSSRQRLLLGALSLSPNVALGRDALIEIGWGERPPANVVELLQTHMSRLRRRLQSARVDTRQERVLVAIHGGYRLEVTEDQLDLLAFRRVLARARQANRKGDVAGACATYRDAFGLWRGEPLADLMTLREHPAVVALNREWQAAVIEYATVAADAGRYEEVLPLLRQVTDADPLHEPAHARLMIALAGAGKQGEALTVYADLRGRLVDELGADPGPEVVGAHQRVLRQEVARGGTNEESPVSAHRQLPPDIADFSGRQDELAAVRAALDRATETTTAVPIIAIEGMAGVGKTRLAVHLAHQLHAEGRFDEHQLYVDLHAHSAEPPADPVGVLGSFLNLLGVPGSQIPADRHERAALYRDRLHDKPTLVLLDNAADAEQVIPLLPADPASLVVITSRRALALDGAHTIPLDVFALADAEELLAKIVGHDRVEVERAAARDMIELCGRLPLAVALVARRLQARPTWSFSDLGLRLRNSGDRMSELAAGTRRVRAAFELSYHALACQSQRVFQLLGLHPGEDFTADSTAALAEISSSDARHLLDHLVDEHLVIASSSDRYRLHDLLREYAIELAGWLPAHDRRDALRRVLRWYVHASKAARAFIPSYRGTTFDLDDAPPCPVPRFTGREGAFRWMEAEQTGLVAAVIAAFDHGLYRTAWELSSMLREYFHLTGNWSEWIRTGEVAIAAAQASDDRRGEALAMLELSSAYGQTGVLDRATDLLLRALELFQSLGDQEREIGVRNNLGIVRGMGGDLAGALAEFEAGLRLSGGEEPSILNNMGRIHQLRGEHKAAVDCFQRALVLRTGVADNAVVVAVWMHSLGESLVQLGRYDEAIPVLTEACRHHRQGQAAFPEAETLETLGTAFAALSRFREARESWERAVRILVDLEHSHAESLRERLAYLESPVLPEESDLARPFQSGDAESVAADIAGTVAETFAESGAEGTDRREPELVREVGDGPASVGGTL